MYQVKFFVFCMLLLFVSCGGESTTDEIGESQDSIAYTITDTTMSSEPVAPPPTAKKDSIEMVLSKKSPFFSLGCCDEKEKRTSKCCCLKVLDKYKKMVENEDKKLGEYKMSDPILGNCRRKMVKAFDLVDDEAVEEEDEENFDDLF